MTASSAFVMSLVELLIIKLGCYLLSFGNEVALLDVLAYVGYKYVGQVPVSSNETFAGIAKANGPSIHLA